jgi:CheY-like chemotaxis protein
MSHVQPQEERKVLVAEDNPALAAVMRFHLERAAFQVEVARDGQEAWDLLQKGTYALVITDQQMPRMSGCEICRRMRQDPRLAGVPILMVTAKRLELESSRIQEELGVREVLPKPFSILELMEAVYSGLDSAAGTGERP